MLVSIAKKLFKGVPTCYRDRYVELGNQDLGSSIVSSSDEFFAEAQNLLNPETPISKPGTFTDKGQWMDGWETRRHNEKEFDEVVIKLAFISNIYAFDVDTSFFIGNHAPYASIEGCYYDENNSEDATKTSPKSSKKKKLSRQNSSEINSKLENLKWLEFVSKQPIKSNSSNIFRVNSRELLHMKINYLKLKIYPDGGVARFRIYGNIVPNEIEKIDNTIDLALISNGGFAVQCTDQHFSNKNNILKPGISLNMGDGWETSRSRELGNSDSVTIKLGVKGTIESFEISTQHFKGNCPSYAVIRGTNIEFDEDLDSCIWKELTHFIKLKPDAIIKEDIKKLYENFVFSHVKLEIIPDGGIARFRVFGKPSTELDSDISLVSGNSKNKRKSATQNNSEN